ncbi:ABC transporter substrate-binding protein [Leeuwenhoekiella sp. NPDC079379]|uniref:ABC transporter substrate-binding protein n=1 Tax=Leeuwenhoekiella sp. NPDC079379 TaxID=3364122 RepID=UPI0037C6CA82
MKDQLGRRIQIKELPKRIVCLVPSLSELLVDLGLSESLVGVTKFCVHPHSLRTEKEVVGGTKTIHKHKIAALNPDFILCNKEENTQDIVTACEAIAPVYVSDINSFDDFYVFLSHLGALFNIQEKTASFILDIKIKREAFRRKTADFPERKVAYLIWKKPLMVAGRDNFINVLLQELNLRNIFEGKEGRYPEIVNLELKSADLVFLSSEPFPFTDQHIQEFQAFTNAKISCVDGEYFSWYGSRLLKAFDYFEKLLKSLN